MPEAPTPMSAFVARNDAGVERLLERQNTNPESRWQGAIADATGLHEPGTASGVLVSGVAAYFTAESKYYHDAQLRKRMKMAADHLIRVQSKDGNYDLHVTNFNSPPDTAFIMRNVATAAFLANKFGDRELFGWMEPSMQRGADGLLKGGIHTPNHRWVACAALAQLQEVLKRPELIGRIDEWLAEGIDIDADGQYSEQSTTMYNAHVDNCLVTVADKLKRPELLEPVRKNLETMLYLLHPNYEVVTEISHRQDRNTIANMGYYWFALRYMARHDNNGQLETVARVFEPDRGSLALLMEYSELQKAGPNPKPVPDNYSKYFPHSNLVHIRRGKTSASIIPRDNSRFFAVRRGEAVVSGVRFAAAFFGKAQFVPTEAEEKNGVWTLEQSLEGPYFQPLTEGRKQPWGVEKWYEFRKYRKQTEVGQFHYTAEVKEVKNGFDLRIRAEGTDWVPLAIEVNLREGGEIKGVTDAPDAEDAFILEDGYATYRRGGDTLRFGPGLAETRYTQVRGAEPKLTGPSVYITGFTPFDRTLEFRWS
ncbi:MAG: hypothetical protein KDC27_09925 [Acidobacteria bacterium]|nr:hypothetical protein [Acidobacteriota bacterium]